ncbi:unnamed protein product [Sphagnum tenellum]
MAVVRPGTTTVMRSRWPSASWVPEDAEELADIGIWQTSRVGSVEEPHGGYQLFSKRAQELVKNSSLRFGTTTMFVTTSEPPDHGVAGPVHGLSRRSMRRLSLDMSSLLTSSSSSRTYDELYCMETIHSPSREILYPMRSLFLDKISSGSASPPELLSPSPKSQQPAGPPAPEVESDKINNTHEQHDQPPVVSSSSLSSELGKEEEEESEAAAAAAELERRPHLVTEDHDEPSCLPARQELSATSAAPNVPVDVVMLVYDAERKPMTTGLEYAINKIVKEGDEIILVGYLQHVMNPMGYKMLADTAQFTAVNEKCLNLEIAEKKKAVEKMIDGSRWRQACEKRKIKLSSRISAGALPRSVVVGEAKSLHATWVIFDRKALKEKKLYYVENLNCHVLKMKGDGRSTETIRSRGPATTLDLATTSPRSVSMAVSSSSTSFASSSLDIDRKSSVSSNRRLGEILPSLWSRFKSFRGSHRRSSSSSSSVSHQSMSRSSSSTEISSTPNCPFIFTSTPEDTQYLDSRHILHSTNGTMFSLDNPANAAAAYHHEQEVKIYSSSSKPLLNLVDPRVLAA